MTTARVRTIGGLPLAGQLDGSETIPAAQGGASVAITADKLAALAAGKVPPGNATAESIGLGNVANLSPAQLAQPGNAVGDRMPGVIQGAKFISQPDAVQIQGGGSTGSIDLMSVQREAAANALAIRAKVGETLSVAEYADENRRLSQSALNKLSARAKLEGKSIIIPGGVWTADGTLSIDRSDQTGFNPAALRTYVIGQGQGTSVWIYTGAGKAFEFKGGGQGTGQEARIGMIGLTVIGPSSSVDGSAGLSLDHVAWIKLDDMHFTNFDKAIDGIDVEYLRSFQVIIRFNKRGVTMISRANNSTYTPDPTSSDPNNHSYIASTIANNSEYGVDYLRGSGLGFYGCDIQYNGNGAAGGNDPLASRPGFAIRNTDPGTQGGTGLIMLGGYVEGNGGVADVWMRQVSSQFSATSAVLWQIDGTGFARSSQTARTRDFIVADFINASGPQSISVKAAFKNFNGATATGPAVRFIGEKQRKDIELDMSGSVYTPGEEVDEWEPFATTVTRPSATSGFAGTVSASFSRKWRTMRVRGVVNVSSIGVGGTNELNVGLLVATRPGDSAAGSAADAGGGGGVVFALALGFTLFLRPELADGRAISFYCEYPIN